MYLSGQARQHRHPAVPKKARAVGSGPLRRREHFPLLGARHGRQVDRAGKLEAGGDDGGLPVVEHCA